MNTGGEAAEQIVRMSLEGFEVAAKITGAGAKNIAILLYTILKEENENVAKAFLQKHPEFVPEPVYPELGGALAQPMVTILPEMFGSDGFFVAKFRRKHS